MLRIALINERQPQKSSLPMHTGTSRYKYKHININTANFAVLHVITDCGVTLTPQ